MWLSEIVGKKVLSAGKIRAICRGVGLNLKTRAVKYLLCADIEKETEIFLPVSAVKENTENIVLLHRFRPIFPKSVSRFFCGRPLYFSSGEYVGIVVDLLIENLFAVQILADTGKSFSALSVEGIADAVILKKKPVFPLGEKLSEAWLSKNEIQDPVVTKTALKKAVEEGSLIRLTLSLPVFNGKCS